ncbi:MAG TPA: hypothetical protein VF370_03975 [Candidatus Cryosericum sp.]
MKTTKSRCCSRITTFLTILLAVVLVAGCAPKANPEPVTDQLFVKEFVSALIDENYTAAAACFAFPIREKELHSWRARIVAAVDPGTLSRFQVGVADNFSFGGVQEYVDAECFRISRDEAFAAIMLTVKKTPEYAKIMKRYGAAMKRLDEAADLSKVDSVTYRDAYQGRIQVDGLCDLLAPKYVVPPADGARCVNVVFTASGYLRGELVTIVRLIPLGSGFGITDFVIGDTQGE